MEVEIVTFVVTESAQLTVSPDRQELIKVGSTGVAIRFVFSKSGLLVDNTEVSLTLYIFVILNCKGQVMLFDFLNKILGTFLDDLYFYNAKSLINT